jgi:hypothetical protein
LFISGVNDTSDKLFGGVNDTATTPLTSSSAVSLTLAINLCHGFSLISGVVGTADTVKNFSPVSTTPPINFLAVSTTPAIRQSCLY